MMPSHPPPEPSCSNVLVLPDFDRTDRIGALLANPKTRTFVELLIDCEEDRTLRAVLGRDAATGEEGLGPEAAQDLKRPDLFAMNLTEQPGRGPAERI